MTASAAHYLAGATRCKKTWDEFFRQSDDGHRLAERQLAEMHGAGLGLMWSTHTKDLHSALAVLHRVDAYGATAATGPEQLRAQARWVLENHIH
jgi:hypothetical protein